MRPFEETDAAAAFAWFSDVLLKIGFQGSHSEPIHGMQR